MSKQTESTQPTVHSPVELSEDQLDAVQGGATKAAGSKPKPKPSSGNSSDYLKPTFTNVLVSS